MLVRIFCSASYNRFAGLYSTRENISDWPCCSINLDSHIILFCYNLCNWLVCILKKKNTTVHLAQDFHTWLLVSALCNIMSLCFPISIHCSKRMNDTEDEFIWCDILFVFTHLLHTSFCFLCCLQCLTRESHYYFSLIITIFYISMSLLQCSFEKIPIDFKRHWNCLDASGISNNTVTTPTPPLYTLSLLGLHSSPYLPIKC